MLVACYQVFTKTFVKGFLALFHLEWPSRRHGPPEVPVDATDPVDPAAPAASVCALAHPCAA